MLRNTIMEIILDTNFLLVPLQFNIDIFEELEKMGYSTFIILGNVEKEANKIGLKEYAAIKKLLKDKHIKTITSDTRNTDTAIFEYAKKHKCAVATNDKALIKKLKKEHVIIIRMRQKKYLIIEN